VNRGRVVVTGGSGFIGIHLIEYLKQNNYELLNIDVRPPKDNRNTQFYQNLSILDKHELAETLIAFDPNYIVHLAAVTTQNAMSLADFEVNIKGTDNLIEIANSLPNLERFIFTSTQYVSQPGAIIEDSLELLKPYGFYGESKLVGEKLVRAKLDMKNWTIIRPANIWGTWHPVLGDGLWRQIQMGRYMHPSQDEAIKGYGFVNNTVWQIEKILSLPPTTIAGRTLYLADENLKQEIWVSLFVEKLTGKKMHKVPVAILYFLSEFGELLHKFGIKFPLYRSRFKNLITSNPVPLEATNEILGPVPFSKQEGVILTSNWLLSIGKQR
jgi:hypothetical protein